MSSGADGPADRSGAAGDGDDRIGALAACGRLQVGDQSVVDLARDVALEAADDLGLGLALGGAALGVGARSLAVAQAADGDHVQRAVGVAVAAVVEAVAVGASGRHRDRAGTAERPWRPGRVRAAAPGRDATGRIASPGRAWSCGPRAAGAAARER